MVTTVVLELSSEKNQELVASDLEFRSRH